MADPFAGLGELHIERAAFESVSQAAFDADPEATLRVMSSATAAVTTGDIRWVIQAALAGNKISQYRLTFNQVTDGDDDDLLTFEPEAQVLSIAYLVP